MNCPHNIPIEARCASCVDEALHKVERGARVKQKKCKVCRQPFTPRTPLQTLCGPSCMPTYAEKLEAKRAKEAAKAERARTRERKEALKSRRDWMREAQTAVNAYVRLRDKGKGCVSCDRPASWEGQWHASHFKSVGANSFLRFNLWNIHKSCSICNHHQSGNIGEYSARLPSRIGKEKFDFLMSAPRSRTYDIEYLKRLKHLINKRAKRFRL